MADLSGGAYLARLLGVSDPGIHKVSQNGEDSRDVPAGARGRRAGWSGAQRGLPGSAGSGRAALATACSSANLLLTLATLDPAFGGDHLGTWTTNAVTVVTAGDSSAERIHSVGEMIRLAGTRLDSAILIGADKSDESLGVMDPADQTALVGPV